MSWSIQTISHSNILPHTLWNEHMGLIKTHYKRISDKALPCRTTLQSQLQWREHEDS